MYEIKGFVFEEKENEIKRFPISPGLLATSYEEVHEAMEAMGFAHYMFLLKEVKE